MKHGGLKMGQQLPTCHHPSGNNASSPEHAGGARGLRDAVRQRVDGQVIAVCGNRVLVESLQRGGEMSGQGRALDKADVACSPRCKVSGLS